MQITKGLRDDVSAILKNKNTKFYEHMKFIQKCMNFLWIHLLSVEIRRIVSYLPKARVTESLHWYKLEMCASGVSKV